MSMKKEIMEAVKAAKGTEEKLVEVKINPFTTLIGGRVQNEIGGGTRKVMNVTVKISTAYTVIEAISSETYEGVEAEILSAIEKAFDQTKETLIRRFKGGLR